VDIVYTVVALLVVPALLLLFHWLSRTPVRPRSIPDEEAGPGDETDGRPGRPGRAGAAPDFPFLDHPAGRVVGLPFASHPAEPDGFPFVDQPAGPSIAEEAEEWLQGQG
jgi:hypothetical protein